MPPINESTENMKNRLAEANVRMLKDFGYPLVNAMILDVGSDIGCNVKAMRDEGSTVLAVEPEKEAYEYGISKGYLQTTDHNCLIEELPKELNGKFDLITIFLFAIPHSARDVVFKRIAQLLKPDGQLIIGTEFGGYVLHSSNDPYKTSIIPTLEKYFSSIQMTRINDSYNNPQKYALIGQKPIKLEEIITQTEIHSNKTTELFKPTPTNTTTEINESSKRKEEDLPSSSYT